MVYTVGAVARRSVVVFSTSTTCEEAADPLPQSHMFYASIPHLNDTGLPEPRFEYVELKQTRRADFRANWGISRGLTVPIWFLAAVSGVLPLAVLGRWQWRRQKTRRAAMGFCRVCGYDLRATPQRCPECGTIPPAVKGAAL
jgi:hypothetical protein